MVFIFCNLGIVLHLDNLMILLENCTIFLKAIKSPKIIFNKDDNLKQFSRVWCTYLAEVADCNHNVAG